MADVKKIATRDSYGEALVELGKERDDFIVMDADLAEATKTGAFKKVFPQRFYDCGIAEGNMISIAAGIAATGKKVFASSFAMFAAGRAFEQIRNSVAYPHLNVVIGATHAGISVGEDGATHQCCEDIVDRRSEVTRDTGFCQGKTFINVTLQACTGNDMEETAFNVAGNDTDRVCLESGSYTIFLWNDLKNFVSGHLCTSAGSNQLIHYFGSYTDFSIELACDRILDGTYGLSADTDIDFCYGCIQCGFQLVDDGSDGLGSLVDIEDCAFTDAD